MEDEWISFVPVCTVNHKTVTVSFRKTSTVDVYIVYSCIVEAVGVDSDIRNQWLRSMREMYNN